MCVCVCVCILIWNSALSSTVHFSLAWLFTSASTLSLAWLLVLARILAELKLVTTRVGETAMAVVAFNDVAPSTSAVAFNDLASSISRGSVQQRGPIHFRGSSHPSQMHEPTSSPSSYSPTGSPLAPISPSDSPSPPRTSLLQSKICTHAHEACHVNEASTFFRVLRNLLYSLCLQYKHAPVLSFYQWTLDTAGCTDQS